MGQGVQVAGPGVGVGLGEFALVDGAIVLDAPVVFRDRRGRTWQPQNDGGGFRGPMRLREALVQPIAEFFLRHRWHGVLILALIGCYRISDVVMGIMANPFYVDMGYTKDEVAAVTKVYGVIMTLAGAFLGGALSMKFGVMRVLMLGAILSAASNLLFAWLGGVGHDVTALIFVISADNLSSGIASAAFIANLSSLTNVTYSATQYALFSSLVMLPGKLLGAAVVDFGGRMNFPNQHPLCHSDRRRALVREADAVLLKQLMSERLAALTQG